MMFGWDVAGTNGWLMLAAMAIIAGTVILSVWLIVHRPGQSTTSRTSAEDLLRERFARGEITREQFEDAKRVLD